MQRGGSKRCFLRIEPGQALQRHQAVDFQREADCRQHDRRAGQHAHQLHAAQGTRKVVVLYLF